VVVEVAETRGTSFSDWEPLRRGWARDLKPFTRFARRTSLLSLASKFIFASSLISILSASLYLCVCKPLILADVSKILDAAAASLRDQLTHRHQEKELIYSVHFFELGHDAAPSCLFRNDSMSSSVASKSAPRRTQLFQFTSI